MDLGGIEFVNKYCVGCNLSICNVEIDKDTLPLNKNNKNIIRFVMLFVFVYYDYCDK